MAAGTTDRNAVDSSTIDFVCDHMGPEWKNLGRELGFSEIELVNIERENWRNQREMCYVMLSKWTEKNAAAQIRELKVAMRKIGKVTAATKI